MRNNTDRHRAVRHAELIVGSRDAQNSYRPVALAVNARPFVRVSHIIDKLLRLMIPVRKPRKLFLVRALGINPAGATLVGKLHKTLVAVYIMSHIFINAGRGPFVPKSVTLQPKKTFHTFSQ